LIAEAVTIATLVYFGWAGAYGCKSN